jgi:predicted Zn-dependent protease
MYFSRRDFVSAGLGGCLACHSMFVGAKVLSTSLEPLVGVNYQPVDADERGLWQSCERLEENLAASELLLRAPDLHDYTLGVLERLLGRPATDARVYIVRDASFNASMFPNGMMLVHTGLLVRARNEAQYAAVLGHEAGHYFRKHSLKGERNRRAKSAAMAFVAAGASVAAGATALSGYDGRSWIDLANSINQTILLSVFSFSRAQESEADAYGIALMAKAGYSPIAASDVWKQLIDERKASAAQRQKKYRDDATSAFSTHPPNAERMQDLLDTAAELTRGSDMQFSDRHDEWQKAIAPYLPSLLDEQIKLNDPGASLYLIASLARDGWTGMLHFYEGEAYRLRNQPGDVEKAASAYLAATQMGDAPPEAWREYGYALMKSGRKDEAHRALSRYLELRPDAKDAQIVRFSLSQ